MKKSLLFSAVLAGLMLGSCSSSDDLAGGNTPANQSGKGYVAFNINLPSQSGSSSRAGSENDQFDAGMKSEYDVKNATLLLFDGSDEGTAQFKKAYPLNTAPWTDKGKTDNVTTTSATIVQQVDAPSTNYLALVVLNSNNVFTLGTDGGITIDGSAFSGTLNDFLTKSAATDGKDLTKAGFYMANAPLAAKAGGSSEPSGATINTLVSLDGKIKETEAEAKAAPAEIYVERGVAKVTMQKGTSTSVTGSKPASSTSEVAFEVNSWTLDNTNKTTYLVRSTEGYGSWLSLASNATGVTNKYRFVGSDEVGSGMYRTYFAKDPNYDTTGNSSATFNSSVTFSSEFGNENPQYCFENTFDVDNQIDKYTTRVLIKAKLNSGNTFYVINGDENTIFDRTAVEKEIKKQFLLEYGSWIKANVTSPTTVDESSLAVDFTDEAGAVTLNSINITGVTYVSGVTSLPSDYIETVMARLGSILEYKNGESYYFVRIKHFGDDLTPWNSTETEKPTSATGVYPSGTNRDGNYLGRYGVLRNNWYDIEVQGVKGLGSPKVPTVTTDTDDELKSYIAVKINVLSWAKRTQGAILH